MTVAPHRRANHREAIGRRDPENRHCYGYRNRWTNQGRIMKQQATLLLVDQDRRLAASMAGWLGEQGYPTETCATLAEGIEAIDRKQYDLVLVDVQLDGDRGFDLLNHSLKTRPETSVIMTSGDCTVASALETIRAGAFDFLTKPLIDQELAMAIERALNQHDQ